MRLIPLRRSTILPIVAAGALLLAACAPAGTGSPAPGSNAPGAAVDLAVSTTPAGDALSGEGGKTLYILTTDTGGTSTCTTGACATAWPALKGDGSAVQKGTGVSGTFGTTTWADGTKQVTHNGQPLYYFSGDNAAGDSNGQGTGGVWFIAPVGEASASHAGAGGNPSAAPGGYGY